ncbi:hypothetical protein JCM19238_1259 [Vibrio ponticus]|nr:hypothetical protein JCM19238_1259 [Vibrio ponticus]
MGNDPDDTLSYVLQADFVEDAQGNRNGEYTITQYQAFEHNNNTDTVQLVFPIAAIDNDGDVTPTNINVTIADGNNISVGNENSNLELIEHVNLDGTADNAISKSTSVEFSQESDAISSVKWEVSDELKNDLLLITTNGKPTVLELSDGLIHLSTYNKNNEKIDVLKIELDADSSGKYTVTQYLPIDNANSNFNELILDLVATDVDGDKTFASTIVSLVDGTENQLQDDEVSLREQVDADGKFIHQTETGDVELIAGSDGVKSWIELIDQESVEKWTSNGKTTKLTTTDNSVLIEDKHGNKILELKYFPEDDGGNKAGTYTVTQYGPIDQLSNDLSQLDLKVTAISPDDHKIEKTITVKIQDGDAMSTNGAIIDPLIEPLIPSNDPSQPVRPVQSTQISGQINLTDGTDAVKKIKFSLNDEALLDNLTSSGQELVVESKNSSFTFYIKDPQKEKNQGEKVLEIEVNKKTGELTVKQHLPLDNNSDGDGNDDQTSIKFDITVTDTDGDKVDDSFDLVLQDGQDPQILGVAKLTVLESGLDTADVAKAQAQKIVFDDRSDNIETINVVHGDPDNYPIILTSGDSSVELPLKSSGNEVLWRPTDSSYEVYFD